MQFFVVVVFTSNFFCYLPSLFVCCYGFHMRILFTFSFLFRMSFIGASFNVLTCDSFVICLLLWLQFFTSNFFCCLPSLLALPTKARILCLY